MLNQGLITNLGCMDLDLDLDGFGDILINAF
jgi:hypothetical protein